MNITRKRTNEELYESNIRSDFRSHITETVIDSIISGNTRFFFVRESGKSTMYKEIIS